MSRVRQSAVNARAPCVSCKRAGCVCQHTQAAGCVSHLSAQLLSAQLSCSQGAGVIGAPAGQVAAW